MPERTISSFLFNIDPGKFFLLCSGAVTNIDMYPETVGSLSIYSLLSVELYSSPNSVKRSSKGVGSCSRIILSKKPNVRCQWNGFRNEYVTKLVKNILRTLKIVIFASFISILVKWLNSSPLTFARRASNRN